MYPKVDDIIQIISTGKVYKVRGMNMAQDEYELMELTYQFQYTPNGSSFYCNNPFPVAFSLNWFMRNPRGWALLEEGGTLKTAKPLYVEEVNKCECGAEAVGASRHSHWCKKHDNGDFGGSSTPLLAI